jgi:hypothetical protein
MEVLRLRLSRRSMKREPYNVLIGKWIDIKFNKKNVRTIVPRQTAYIGNVPKAGFQL